MRAPGSRQEPLLGRLNLGPADIGLMAGWFHEDVVVGGFVTANVRGTGLRGEVAFTNSGDPWEPDIDRGRFCRASVGDSTGSSRPLSR